MIARKHLATASHKCASFLQRRKKQNTGLGKRYTRTIKSKFEASVCCICFQEDASVAQVNN